MKTVLRTRSFWIAFAATAVVTGIFFLWELGMLAPWIPSLPRATTTPIDIIFSIAIGLLLSLNAGLTAWALQKGHCPIGARNASGIAAVIGAVALLCPICIAVPLTLFGIGFSLALLAPFLPLLRVVALILLAASLWMLWPKGMVKSKG